MDKEKKDMLFFGYGLGIISAVFAVGGALRHGFFLPQKVLLICSLIFFTVTALNWKALRPGYKGWMKVAHRIGGVVTVVVLTLVFGILFVPVGIFFRVIGKDHLRRKYDAGKSYWQERLSGAVDRERYKQQF